MSDAIRTEMILLLPRLRAYARSLTMASDQADDLVQQTCEKALGNLSSFQTGTRLDSWMFRIMRNTWVDDRRTWRPTTQLDEAAMAAPLIGDDGPALTESRLHLQDVSRAMLALTQDQRVVLMLVCVEGMRYRDAAEALDIPEGTVMSRLARARIALAQALKEPAGKTDEQQGARR